MAQRLPACGRIGIFNRSHYEEVLTVRIHKQLLEQQKLPGRLVGKNIWQQRFDDIRAFERHLVRNGTLVLKRGTVRAKQTAILTYLRLDSGQALPLEACFRSVINAGFTLFRNSDCGP